MINVRENYSINDSKIWHAALKPSPHFPKRHYMCHHPTKMSSCRVRLEAQEQGPHRKQVMIMRMMMVVAGCGKSTLRGTVANWKPQGCKEHTPHCTHTDTLF